MTANRYALLTAEQKEELFSNYLIDSWSYSKVATFARNEKDFERRYIYREPTRLSASSVAGSAYHDALAAHFNALADGEELTLPELEQKAFAYIDEQSANVWQLSKTAPTVEDCRLRATRMATALLHNFYKEQAVYTDAIAAIQGVELRMQQWLTLNGVDIPLPCVAVADLVVTTPEGITVVIDHKTRAAYTDADELAFVSGKQAITYALCYEQATGTTVDEVWFVENKHSANKDGSPQLRVMETKLDADTRRLYEAMLYESLRRMLQAVSDPDYVYTINDADNFTSRAEIYRFWTKTMIAEVDDFRIPDNKKALIERRLRKIRDASLSMVSPTVIRNFQRSAASFIAYDLSQTDMNNKEKIEHALRTFGILVRVAHELRGFSCCTYLLEVSAGVKVANVAKYAMDIANALDVPAVRIGERLTVYEGRSYLSVEVSRKSDQILPWSAAVLQDMRLPLGVDNFGRIVVWDLDNHATPHVLICGATGSGKSVCIASTIRYALRAGVPRVVIFDPKYEFGDFAAAHPSRVKVYNDIADIEAQMKALVADMQERAASRRSDKTLVIFDEFADAVSAARSGAALDIREKVPVGERRDGSVKYEVRTVGREKSLEENLKMLLQKGRSLGFRVVAATQRASVSVITGDAKVNLPVQICFRVPKEVDSKVVLDEPGAETLNGRGDGLIRSPQYDDLVRFQGFYSDSTDITEPLTNTQLQ